MSDYNYGDVISIGAVRADGTIAPDHKASSADKTWRVGKTMPDGRIRLHPLNTDGTLDEFNDACGEFFLTPKEPS